MLTTETERLSIKAVADVLETRISTRGNVTSAGWQVTLCDPMWHVSSRSGVATLRTAIYLLLTYLLTCQEGTGITELFES